MFYIYRTIQASFFLPYFTHEQTPEHTFFLHYSESSLRYSLSVSLSLCLSLCLSLSVSLSLNLSLFLSPYSLTILLVLRLRGISDQALVLQCVEMHFRPSALSNEFDTRPGIIAPDSESCSIRSQTIVCLISYHRRWCDSDRASPARLTSKALPRLLVMFRQPTQGLPGPGSPADPQTQNARSHR